LLLVAGAALHRSPLAEHVPDRQVVRSPHYTDTWQFAEVTAVTPALAHA